MCECTCMCVHHREKYIKMAEAYEVLPVNLAPPSYPLLVLSECFPRLSLHPSVFLGLMEIPKISVLDVILWADESSVILPHKGLDHLNKIIRKLSPLAVKGTYLMFR